MSTPESAATRIDEVVDGIYRISTFVPEFELGFNQFLIDDERPALLHTGDYQMYEGVRRAIAEVLDPSRLAFVALSTSRATSAAAWTASPPRRPTRR